MLYKFGHVYLAVISAPLEQVQMYISDGSVHLEISLHTVKKDNINLGMQWPRSKFGNCHVV